MYHKVNDIPANPTTVPTVALRRADGAARRARLPVVASTRCSTTTRDGAPLPPGPSSSPSTTATATTSRMRSRSSGYGYPAVLFVADRLPRRRPPAPARGAARARAAFVNRDARLGRAARARRGGVRIESHGISHRPVAELELGRGSPRDRALEAQARGAARPPGRAFAYVKGSEPHYKPVHLSLVRRRGTSSASPRSRARTGRRAIRFRLRRYNVEPYPPRTFELVLAGACDLIAVKDTVPGTYARRALQHRRSARRPSELHHSCRLHAGAAAGSSSSCAASGATHDHGCRVRLVVRPEPGRRRLVSLARDEGDGRRRRRR